METRTVQVFQYDELSDKAKERARDWYREADAGDSSFADFTVDDAVTIAGLLGFDITTSPAKLYGGGTRQEPNVYWHLGYSQGDGASFDAHLSYRKGCVQAVKAYAPQDTELHRIAKAWAAAQRAVFYKAGGTVKCRGIWDRSFEWCNDETGAYYSAETDRDLAEPVRDFMAWIYDRIREEHEYQTADEQVAENIRANEYEFTEDGRRYRY